jgi:hypothetical protein
MKIPAVVRTEVDWAQQGRGQDHASMPATQRGSGLICWQTLLTCG